MTARTIIITGGFGAPGRSVTRTFAAQGDRVVRIELAPAAPDADTSQSVRPEAIADVIAFLASPAARSITGALIPVSRGSAD